MVIIPAWYSAIHSILGIALAQISALFHHVAHWVLRTPKRGLKWGFALAGIAVYGVGLTYMMVDAGWFSAILLILMAPGLVFLTYLLFKTPHNHDARISRGHQANPPERSRQA